MPATEERCDLTDLLPSDCGCKKHRDSEGIDARAFKIRNTVLAMRDGVCILNEDHLIVVDDEIGMVCDNVPPGSVTTAHGWACVRCTRQIQSVKP